MEDLDTKATLTGVAISLGGNILISLALNVQKLAHVRMASPSATPAPGSPPEATAASGPSEQTPLMSEPNPWASEPSQSASQSKATDTTYFKSPLWWLGLLGMSLGEAGNFVSYGFAPPSVIAPLGTAALVANWVFAPLILGERFRSQDTLGCALAIIGASTIVLSSRTSQPVYDPPTLLRALQQVPFIVYSSVTSAAIFILVVLSELEYDNRYLLIDIVLCALLGGFTVLSTKAVSSLFNALFYNAFQEPIFWGFSAVLVVTALGQLRYLNKALQKYDSKHVVPTQFCFFTVSVLVGSAFLYRDFDDISSRRFVTFLLGLGTILIGVALLTPGRSTDGEGPAEEGDQRREEVDLTSPTVSRTTTPLLPTIHLPPLASPSLPLASPQQHSRRLRSLSSASVRGLSSGGLLLSSSLGRQGSLVVVLPSTPSANGGSTDALERVGSRTVVEEAGE